MSANNQTSEQTHKQTKLSFKTQKRKNVKSESVVLPEHLPEKVFAIDLTEDVIDMTSQTDTRGNSQNSRPFNTTQECFTNVLDMFFVL